MPKHLLEHVPTVENNGVTFHTITEMMGTNINQLCEVVNDWAEKKGWNEFDALPDERSQRMYKGEKIALMHSELSEQLEAIRQKGVHMDDKVPELTGESAELADLLIRAFHYAGEMGINLGEAVAKKHAFNITRPYRHGKAS